MNVEYYTVHPLTISPTRPGGLILSYSSGSLSNDETLLHDPPGRARSRARSRMGVFVPTLLTINESTTSPGVTDGYDITGLNLGVESPTMAETELPPFQDLDAHVQTRSRGWRSDSFSEQQAEGVHATRAAWAKVEDVDEDCGIWFVLHSCDTFVMPADFSFFVCLYQF